MPSLTALSFAPVLSAIWGVSTAATAAASVDITQTTVMTQIFDYIGPILSTGLVGVILLMILMRFKIMPTYVHEDAKTEWDRERSDLQADIADLKQTLKDANSVYTQQVIPTLTLVLDAQKELVELRRTEQFSRAVRPNANG